MAEPTPLEVANEMIKLYNRMRKDFLWALGIGCAIFFAWGFAVGRLAR